VTEIRPTATSRHAATGAATTQHAPRQRPLTMPEQIAESVTSAILRGEYRPGDPVREQELADQFHVSRGPIREALRILEKAGAVTILPHRGAYVTQLSAQEINNVFEIRCALAQLLPRYLLLAGPKVLGDVETLIAELDAASDDPNGWDAHVNIVHNLNNLLCDSCANPQLAEILRSLAQQMARYTRLGLRESLRREASVKGWRRFLGGLKRGDAEKAGAALSDLINASRKAVLKALSDEDHERNKAGGSQ
jgi:DNA-binding GntR family transcriptional regulator